MAYFLVELARMNLESEYEPIPTFRAIEDTFDLFLVTFNNYAAPREHFVEAKMDFRQL